MNDNHKKLSVNDLRALNRELDHQLKELQASHKSGNSSSSKPLLFKRLILGAILFIASLIAPFIMLIRVSVAMYANYQLNGWLALSVGVVTTVLLLMSYALFLAFQYRQKICFHKYIRRGIAGLVIAYTFYGLLYHSGLNTKNDDVKSYYRSLHPIMRVALVTITLADNDLLVTDIQREPQDYSQMGLAENRQSLHYIQANGYVHAIDLCTKGRAEWKNWFSRLTFNVIGLQTIRHVGTADHLHVYLPLNEW